MTSSVYQPTPEECELALQALAGNTVTVLLMAEAAIVLEVGGGRERPVACVFHSCSFADEVVLEYNVASSHCCFEKGCALRWAGSGAALGHHNLYKLGVTSMLSKVVPPWGLPDPNEVPRIGLCARESLFRLGRPGEDLSGFYRRRGILERSESWKHGRVAIEGYLEVPLGRALEIVASEVVLVPQS